MSNGNWSHLAQALDDIDWLNPSSDDIQAVAQASQIIRAARRQPAAHSGDEVKAREVVTAAVRHSVDATRLNMPDAPRLYTLDNPEFEGTQRVVLEKSYDTLHTHTLRLHHLLTRTKDALAGVMGLVQLIAAGDGRDHMTSHRYTEAEEVLKEVP